MSSQSQASRTSSPNKLLESQGQEASLVQIGPQIFKAQPSTAGANRTAKKGALTKS